jgi:hypothetical protein
MSVAAYYDPPPRESGKRYLALDCRIAFLESKLAELARERPDSNIDTEA